MYQVIWHTYCFHSSELKKIRLFPFLYNFLKLINLVSSGLSGGRHRLWCIRQDISLRHRLQLWHTGSLAQDLSSLTRERTHVPALQDGFFTTGPPGKSSNQAILNNNQLKLYFTATFKTLLFTSQSYYNQESIPIYALDGHTFNNIKNYYCQADGKS